MPIDSPVIREILASIPESIDKSTPDYKTIFEESQKLRERDKLEAIAKQQLIEAKEEVAKILAKNK